MVNHLCLCTVYNCLTSGSYLLYFCKVRVQTSPVEYVGHEEGVEEEEEDVAGEVEEEQALHAPPLELQVRLHHGVKQQLARRRALEVQHVLQDAAGWQFNRIC